MEHLPVLREGLRRARLDGASRWQGGRSGARPLVATFILVHGGWHGGWCWARVAKTLRSAGHDVYTPTMTGLGERAHLVSRDVSLETHVADVAGVLEYEDLTNANLVGHSASGAVITAVADRAANRVGQLIYLDAVVTDEGQSAWDAFGRSDREGLTEFLATSDVDWLLPVPNWPDLFGIRDTSDVEWVRSRLTPQPVRPWREPVHLRRRTGARLTYVYCDRPGNGYADTAARVRTDPAWRYRELKTGHDAMVTAPRELADVLVELAVR